MVEGATLPRLRAAGFEARVNAYVVGRTERMLRHASAAPNDRPASREASPQANSPATTLSPGCANGVTDLWYLSLVAPRGQGTTLRALWANLVSNRDRSVWLEGVGSVALGQHRLDLTTLGYPIHWTYRQALIPPSRDVQSVLEADALTCYDPLLVPPTSSRRQRASNQPTHRRRKATAPERTEQGAMTLSSRGDQGNGAGASESAAEATAREARPLFLLLARGGDDATDEDGANTKPQVATIANGNQDAQARRNSWLARLHLRFLATRIAWLPYYPRWADYLWQRALDHGEAEPLLTWSYVAPVAAALAGSADAPGMLSDTSSAALTSAYLCHPDPLALTADLQQAIRAGVFVHPVSQHAPQHERPAQTPSVAVVECEVGSQSQADPLAPAA